jgi:hypothetical protein
LYIFLIPPMFVTWLAHLILLDLITLITFVEVHKEYFIFFSYFQTYHKWTLPWSWHRYMQMGMLFVLCYGTTDH